MQTFSETPFNFIKNYYSAFHFNMVNWKITALNNKHVCRFDFFNPSINYILIFIIKTTIKDRFIFNVEVYTYKVKKFI